jgi:peptide/nickel transport system substrate-binding protein
MLSEAGWSDTDGDGVVEKDLGDGRRTPLRFRLLHFRGRADHEGMSAIVKENWRVLGVDVVLDAVDSGVVQQLIIRRNYEGLLNSWNTLHDPDVYTYFHSNAAMAGPNYAVWRNPEADRLLELGQAEADVAKRREIYFKFQEFVREEQPLIFTFHPRELNARNKKVQGLMRAPYGRINSYWMHKMWIAQ